MHRHHDDNDDISKPKIPLIRLPFLLIMLVSIRFGVVPVTSREIDRHLNNHIIDE